MKVFMEFRWTGYREYIDNAAGVGPGKNPWDDFDSAPYMSVNGKEIIMEWNGGLRDDGSRIAAGSTIFKGTIENL